MNEFYKKMSEMEPTRFKGKVSVLAYSLGSIIGYDLMKR